MPLASGTRFGSYEISSPLGAGGMGEVYRARDTKLGRDVALKILPATFRLDPDRLARFKREAQVLASLNHPNIAAIHGFEDSTEHPALVLELVEGPNLAERLTQGAIPIDEALAVARQICSALEAAHDQGIVHRDLKPANITVRPDGMVKVLDFGLAKALEPIADATDAMSSPTITSPALTQMGIILGTAAYMSPEQARGRPADKRSDIWAFGCVLYEMLTGRRTFDGEEVSDTLASVLKSDPDWRALPPSLPPTIRVIVEGCLKKDRRERIGDMSAVRFLLNQPVTPTATTSVPPRAPRARWFGAALLTAGAAVGALAMAGVWEVQPVPPAHVTGFSIGLPEGHQFSLPRIAVAISPDGTRIVYAAEGRLYLRSMADLESRPIPGTEGGIGPVFSPDSRFLAFSVGGELKQIAVSGGVPVPLCRTGIVPSSVTWDAAGILFTLPGRGVLRVSRAGGDPEVLVEVGSSDGLASDAQLLPDGDTVLFTQTTDMGVGSTSQRWNVARVVVHSLKSGKRDTLFEPGNGARYVPTGHIVYALGDTLFIRSFDLKNLRVSEPSPIVDQIRPVIAVETGGAQFAFSSTGTLVYLPGFGVSDVQQLYLFDRSGSGELLKLQPGVYNYPRVSPDGNLLAYQTTDGKQSYIALYYLKTGETARLTYGGNNQFPIWSRDGKYVAFQSNRFGDPAVFRQSIDGGEAEQLTKPEPGTSHVPEAWSPKEDVLLVNITNRDSSALWTFSMRDRRLTRFADVTSTLIPTNAVFSPDGRWIAYQASESRTEGGVYVRPYPPNNERHQIAQGGRPLWSHDGTELFYIPGPTQLRVVTITTQPRFRTNDPKRVPRGFGVSGPLSPRMFDMTSDGRILGGAPPKDGAKGLPAPATELRVVLNWFEELKAGTFRR